MRHNLKNIFDTAEYSESIKKSRKTRNEWVHFLNQGKIVPYFQPILSIENKLVFGYEALARIILADGSIDTIGSFFQSNQDNAHRQDSNYRGFQINIEQHLREQALKKLIEDSNSDSKLFLNISPSVMMAFLDNRRSDNEIPPTIQKVMELGISPERIVIEVTEDHTHKNLEVLKPLIRLYKDFGFLIAIDDLGSKSSNLDRIGIFSPDIIKVDMDILRLSLIERSYREILYTLSRLSESLGVSLLFEGVETMQELHQAMSFGARYLQGYLFEKALKLPPDAKKYSSQLSELINNFYGVKFEEIRYRVKRDTLVEASIDRLGDQIQFSKEGNIISYADVFDIDQNIFRFFVTDLQGNQISPNYKRSKNSEVSIQRNTKNYNWSWRPYFQNHLYESHRRPDSWVISQPYQDILGEVLLRTFSRTFRNHFILYLDVLYEE